jgi:transcriptional regulator with XRE-family HTH domain
VPTVARKRSIENVRQFAGALDDAIKRSGLSGPRIAEKATATGVNVAQSTIATWLGGKRPGRPEQVFAVEKALDLPPGSLSAYLGYLPTELYRVGIEAAIALDDTLDERARQSLLDMIKRHRPAGGDVSDTP